MKQLLLAIDGNSLLYQAYHAFFKVNLTTRDGFPTGALKGFFTKLLELFKLEPTHVLVAFDVHQPTFRHEQYADYKLGRKPADEDLLKQMAVVRTLLHEMGIAVVECPRYEADDILGTFAKRSEAVGVETILVTGDRDAFQLIDENTKVYYTRENAILDKAALWERYGLEPARMKDLKALMGDASDHIPGVAGVGEKTALKLLATYGSLDEVLAHSGEIKGKLGERIAASIEDAKFSYWLGAICCDAPVSETLDDCAFKAERLAGGRKTLLDLELNSIANRLPTIESEPSPSSHQSAVVTPIQSEEALFSALSSGETASAMAIVLEPLLGFAFDEGTSFVLTAGETLFDVGVEEDAAFAAFSSFIKAHPIPVLTFDGKRLLHKLSAADDVCIAFDAMIADYLLGSNRPIDSFASLCRERLGAEQADAACLFALRRKMEQALHDNALFDLYQTVEMPLMRVLYDMECIGFLTDESVLLALHASFSERTKELERRIYEQAGETFNILSTKQLGTILFEKLGLPTQKKTKTGYSTDADTLESLSGLHPIVSDVLQYRFLTKLDSTFIEGLLKQREADGRIRTRFMQCVTATGRISSVEPNLQNIPVRTAEGREIRKAFIPSPGNVLVGADYSQIELRLLAHISGDADFIRAFNDGEDIHARTAAEVFHVPLASVTKEQRSAAKAVNFGIVYGISDFGLAKNLNVSVRTASDYIKRYFERYPKVQQYMQESVALGKERGYAITLFGRRRPLPELKSSNYNVRQFGERVAMNMPIQGSAADVIKMAMIAVHRALIEGGYRARLVLQIHDELIVDAPQDEAERVKALMDACMEHVADLSVQLAADATIGRNWYETK